MERIAIHSVPRSGSTWLGNIFNSHPSVSFKYQPLFSYAFKGKLTSESTKEEIILFFNSINNSNDEFINQVQGVKEGLIPLFSKDRLTHICYKEVRYHHIIENLIKKDDQLKVIGLVRNPFSVINSWLKAPKEFKKELGWKIKEEWRYAPSKNLNKEEEFNGYEKWCEVAQLFIRLAKKYPNQFYLLKYDDLISSPSKNVEKLFHFCELEFRKQTIDFLYDSTQKNDKDSYSVYKQKTSDNSWRIELPEYIIQSIMKDEVFHKINKTFKWTF